jgi:hypothetical protein
MRPRGRIISMLVIALCLMVAVPSSHPQSQQTSESKTRENMEAMQRQQERWREQTQRQQEQWREQMARFQEQLKRDSRRNLDEAKRQAIGATPSQWRAIRPRLEAVEALRWEEHACLRPQVRLHTSNSVAQCQWTWENIFALDPDKPPTAAETTCRVLRDMLADERTPIETIWEQVELLRAQRKHAAEQVPVAQQALRKVATLRQEAALTVMGSLN